MTLNDMGYTFRQTDIVTNYLIGYLVRRWWRMLHTPTRVG